MPIGDRGATWSVVLLKDVGVSLFLVLTAALSFAAAKTPGQEQSVPLMTPLEHVRDPLQRALSALTHAANQSCDVKEAIVDIKGALKDIAAGEMLLARDPTARTLPPLPADVTPDFTPPPRPAPRRNEMLEGAVKNLETAFHRLTEANGGDWGGGRDKAYHHIDDAAKHLIATIKASNAAFREGRRELPSCKPEPL
jgi:hypothetical protein